LHITNFPIFTGSSIISHTTDIQLKKWVKNTSSNPLS
jgi:hypothetical protein